MYTFCETLQELKFKRPFQGSTTPALFHPTVIPQNEAAADILVAFPLEPQIHLSF